MLQIGVTPYEMFLQAVGARDDPAFTRSYARDLARELQGVGIDLNLAPVVDLDLIRASGLRLGVDPLGGASHV